MKRSARILAAFTGAASLIVISRANAGWFDDHVTHPIGHAVAQGVHDAGKAIGTAAQQTGKAVETATHQTGAAIETATHQTGAALEIATHQTGTALEIATHQTGNALEIATHQTGHAVEKATHDVGRGFDQTGQWIGKHPWETVAAVALIAGGGYLIVAQHFVVILSVEGVQVATITTTAAEGVVITAGAASGIATGGTAIAGAGLMLANAASRSYGAPIPADTPATSGGVQSGSRTDPQTVSLSVGPDGAMTITTTAGQRYTTSPVNLPGASAGQAIQPVRLTPSSSGRLQPDKVEPPSVRRGGDGSSGSVMYAPWLRNNATDLEKLAYAEATLSWAEKTSPVSKFDPSATPEIAAAEKKLLDAFVVLNQMPDTEADQMERSQMGRTTDPVGTAIGAITYFPYSVAYQMIFNGKYMDEAVTPEGVFGFVVPHGNVALELIRPTVASEGIGLEKDRLNKAIRKELTDYVMKRMPMNLRQFSEATRMRPEAIRPVPRAEYVSDPH